MIQTINVANINTDRYIWQLRGAYSGMRLHDPDFALARDPEVYEKMLRDPTIRQCLGDRLRSVAGGKWRIDPIRNPTEPDEAAADLVDKLLSEIVNFTASRVALAKFVFEGRRFAVVEGKRYMRDFGDGTMREWWMPSRLRDVGKRRVRTWRTEEGWTAKIAKITEADGGRSDADVDMPSDRIVTAVYEDEESRLGYGRPLGDSVYWYFYAKWRIMEEGLQGVTQWARGFRVAKVADAPMGDTTQGTEAIRDTVIDVVRKAQADGVIVLGKDDELDVIWPDGTGLRWVMEFMVHFDNRIRMLLTGSLLPTGAGEKVGSNARAKEEGDTAEGVAQIDSDIMDEALTQGLIRSTWNRNLQNLRELGLEEARMPRFKSEDEKREDHEKNATVIATVLGAGMPIKADEAYEKTGLTKPTDEDEEDGNIIQPPAQPSPGSDPFGIGAGAPVAGTTDVEGTPAPEVNAEGGVVAGAEEVAAAGIEPPNMQELSLALERAIKNKDRFTANVMRKKLLAVTGEDATPDISDAEWATMAEEEAEATVATDAETVP